MIQLVLIYCLVANPASCVEARPAFEQPLTPMSCMMNAQMVAQQYVTTHPEWRLSSWRCEVNVPRQNPA
jgi:hypothetical protein